MLHHLSIAVTEPNRVARVFAELMNGRFFDFPVHPGAYMAMAGEVVPKNRTGI